MHFRRITSIYQPTNAHIISHKTHFKHFKTLRHASILSDHHQGALFRAKGILRYSQFNSYLRKRCCGSISCCVGMCCGAVARCALLVWFGWVVVLRAAAYVVFTVRMVPCESHGTIRIAQTTHAAALKTTTHPKTRCRKPYAATQHLMLLMMGAYTRNMSS